MMEFAVGLRSDIHLLGHTPYCRYYSRDRAMEYRSKEVGVFQYVCIKGHLCVCRGGGVLVCMCVCMCVCVCVCMCMCV